MLILGLVKNLIKLESVIYILNSYVIYLNHL